MRLIALATTALLATTVALTSCSAPQATEEDQPGWNCYTQGNLICGPSTDADMDAAWQAWDYSGGPSKLKVDTSRGFRVDFIGTAVDYPKGLMENDLPLVGKDTKWYVFRAVPTTKVG